MFDQPQKQSIDRGGSFPDVAPVDNAPVNNTPSPNQDLFPQPKKTLPPPPAHLSSFPPEKIGDIEDIFAEVDVSTSKIQKANPRNTSEGTSKKSAMGMYIVFGALALVICVGGVWLVVANLMSSDGTIQDNIVKDMPGEVVNNPDIISDEDVKEEPVIDMNQAVIENPINAHFGGIETSQLGNEPIIEDQVDEQQLVEEEPVVVNIPQDTDSDGLIDGDEAQLGTNPILVDTDGDGLTDYEEVKVYFTNPLQSDTDSDGLFDAEEIGTYFTDPSNSDTDGDGYEDGLEVSGGYNPLGAGKLNQGALSI
ncbi:hypothetical protein ISS03_02370 [Patescibacteria group bacterium]|nr:hypothetical protein [Patescibacteria group bacterium]